MPVPEIAELRIVTEPVENHTLEPGKTLEMGQPGDLFDVEMELAVLPDSSFGIRFCDKLITWSKGRIKCLGQKADIPAWDGLVNLRILVDCTSIELFGNNGEVCMSSCFLPTGDTGRVQICADKQSIQIRAMTVHGLSSAWRNESNRGRGSF